MFYGDEDALMPNAAEGLQGLRSRKNPRSAGDQTHPDDDQNEA